MIFIQSATRDLISNDLYKTRVVSKQSSRFGSSAGGLLIKMIFLRFENLRATGFLKVLNLKTAVQKEYKN